ASDPVAAVETTLRMIASLPAPEGLAERLQAGLRSAPPTARVLSWPGAQSSSGQWMRCAAAAAIVAVVTGGGWTIWNRVQPAPSARVLALPAQNAPTAGFSTGGAKRVPNT